MATEMQLNRQSLSPIHCASRDETRFMLNQLRVEPDGSTIATNGHLMARVIPSEALTGGEQLEPFEISHEIVTPLLKELKGRQGAPYSVDSEQTNANGHCRATQTKSGAAVELPKTSRNYGEFPDWKQVIPSEPADFVVTLGLNVLETMLATAREFTETRKGGGKGVRFEFLTGEGKELSPIRATVEGEGTLEIVLMPMRS